MVYELQLFVLLQDRAFPYGFFLAVTQTKPWTLLLQTAKQRHYGRCRYHGNFRYEAHIAQ